MSQEQHVFQAEVARLLDIVAHSLYSNKEVFLRELISNASDACDKLRYAAITQPDLIAADADPAITLSIDKEARTVTVADNGIGMNHDELVKNLGTIAHSGTAAFLDQLGEDKSDSANLIGQFGVGFYSAFMVADQITVLSRKAGESQAWTWHSDGKGSFTVAEVAAKPEGQEDQEVPKRGTWVIVTLGKDYDEFLEAHRLRAIVKTYSDHIAVPILLQQDDDTPDRLNEASALWSRPKNDITEEQYREFYHHVGHAFDDPWLTIHNRQEGVIEYTNLLFIPATRPMDLFDPARRHRVKLYVRRVFISDDNEELLPPWLRFLRGIVDSEDLPLNISREMLQHNPVLSKIRTGLIKRVLGELKKQAKAGGETYATFWENFGSVLKEGLYEDSIYRDDLLALARFRATDVDGLTSLADYVAAMRPGQDDIFYLTGDNSDAMAKSPQLEAFRKRGISVLLLADPIDEFWLPVVGIYQGKQLRSVTRGDIDLDVITPSDEAAAATADEDKTDAPDISGLTALFKLTLADTVKDVRASHRLTDSAVCLVADDGDLDMHIERLMRQHRPGSEDVGDSKRILELNPRHPLIRQLAETVADTGDAGQDMVADIAHLLLDQALILEGETVPDPMAFAQRLTTALAKGLPT
ncbi:MAG: molecular chaperone HtpG [Alphaproteobacteria bacterium]